VNTPEKLSSMLCPVCHTGLNMSERQGVEIDYCPQCRGVWLDRGELDKIIERSAQMDAPAPPPQSQPTFRPDRPAQPSALAPAPDRGNYRPHYEGDYRPKRKKSFLEELFD
tara:strand:+ start:1959 stop:2291 length:333 start_codon:yes stop_codon:yes gene_type:complete